ncbi:carbohydrate ABC transporter permease [Pseudolysinimonas sp.]|uniref:carbohydrate ABC transporter permease n=1 Tax=Pseudolysinimonas sp. TaxID=2680009 RepID=UPI003F7E58C7
MARRRFRARDAVGRGARTLLLVVLTAVVLIPVAAVVGRTTPSAVGTALDGPGTTWLGNSLTVALATTAASLAIGAPAGYVVSRARGRWVSGYALLLFGAQSLPIVVVVVPLFILIAGAGLADSLAGIEIVYVGSTVAVAAWMSAAVIDEVPIELEEAAWIDGCRVAAGFARIVLRAAAPGLVPVAIFVFLQAWNEYMVAVTFLRSDEVLTLGVAIAGSGSTALATVMMVPPVVLAMVLVVATRGRGLVAGTGPRVRARS